MLKLQEKGAEKGGTMIKWNDLVHDLWEKHLPHLREEQHGDGMLIYDANTKRFGYEEYPVYLPLLPNEDEAIPEDQFMNALQEEATAVVVKSERAVENGEERSDQNLVSDSSEDSISKF